MGEHWKVRDKKLSMFDPFQDYGQSPDFFTIMVNHGGVFLTKPTRNYAEGKCDYIDMVDCDKFSVLELDDMMHKIGYPEKQVMLYHYLIPGSDINFGLRPLATDDDTRDMLSYVPRFKLIEVYVELWSSRLGVRYHHQSPVKKSGVVIEELDDPNPPLPVVKSRPKLKPKRKLLGLGWKEPTNVEDDPFVGLDQISTPTEFEKRREMTIEEAESQGLNNIEEDDPVALDEGMTAVEDEGMPAAQDVVMHEAEGANEEDEDEIIDEYNEVEEHDMEMGHYKPDVDDGAEELDNDQEDEEREDTTVDLDDFDDNVDDEDEDPLENVLRKHRRSKKTEKNVEIPFYIGQLFDSKDQLKELIKKLAVDTRRQLHIVRNEKLRFRVVCLGINPIFVAGQSSSGPKKSKTVAYCGSSKSRPTPTCSWALHLSRKTELDSWVVKTFSQEHTCLQTRNVTLYTVSSIAKEIEGVVQSNPTIPMKALQEQLQKHHQIEVPLSKIFMAKTMAKNKVNGDYAAQYLQLRDYLDELMRANPGTTVKVDVEPGHNANSETRQFRRVYVCIGALKAGFKLSGRDILGLDGCFMKGPYPGQILTAVGIDANNVNKELLWKCASATTIQKFNMHMETVKEQNPALHKWLQAIPPKHWTRSHFSGRPKSDVLLNNICEVFNRQLVTGRDRPIISCLEYIREYIMRRISVVNMLIKKCNGPLTPTATKNFHKIKEEASQYIVMFDGGKMYQVSGPWDDQRVVDMERRTCTCRRWELTGMPCRHAVAVCWDILKNGEDVGIPESWVDEVYWLDTWRKVYSHTVKPLNGKDLWVPNNCPTSLLPPKHHVQVGRPKKARKK